MSAQTLVPQETDAIDSFWRSLRFFSIYRLSIAVLFLVAALVFGDTVSLGTQDARLFGRVAAVYLLLAIGFLVALLRRPRRFNLQLSVQVAVDIAALTLMMFASGGQKSGIAVLLLVVVAGAGLVGQGRMTLFYAALASVAMLLEESWRALTLEADPGDFVRTGIISIAFFGTAIIAQLLARRVVANETLARERGRELNDQLRISERIIRDMEDGVLVVDGDGRVRLLNPRAQALLDVSASDGTELAALSAELADRYRMWCAQPVEMVEMLRQEGGSLLRVRYLPAAETGGHALIYLEDMERVQSQAQQLKLAALGRLTANMAHEIRNPLAAISHAAELLAEEDTDPLHQRLARIIHDNTRRLNRLVTEVLELGRRDRAQPETLRWRAFLSGFLEELALHDASAAKRIHVGEGDVELRFDRGHLYRVLWNLLANALRHASAADGAVRLEARAVAAANGVELHIIDDGPGVDEAQRNQVFEPFFTTHGAGTGLGLYIARELCEASGAHLELLDERPGAHFRISAEGVVCR
ncbi:MAG: ATP-binding protein [Rhodocyclales bacterium]|nr:ATP-binding protein [Rhodocyclales bacterium]